MRRSFPTGADLRARKGHCKQFTLRFSAQSGDGAKTALIETALGQDDVAKDACPQPGPVMASFCAELATFRKAITG